MRYGHEVTQWLDERESTAWRSLHRMHADVTAVLARQLAADSDLTPADYAVLVNVSEAPGRRLRARDLCHQLQWERSRLSHQVSRMEARGTVRKEPCPDDARGFDVVLTRAGLRAIKGAAPCHVAAVRHCFADVLTPRQLEALTEIAETVVRHIEAEHTFSE